MFADFVIVALASPCVAIVIAGYGLLAAALIGSLREKLTPKPSDASWRTPAKN